jgi:hypothetical protein
VTPIVSEGACILSGELGGRQLVYKVPSEGLGILNDVLGVQGRVTKRHVDVTNRKSGFCYWRRVLS